MPNRIHPTAVVGEGVHLGDDNVVGPYSVLVGPLRIGSDTWIGAHVCLGMPPEHRDHGRPVAWEGELEGAGVVVGDGVLLREFSTVHQGTERATVVGDGSYLMSRSYVGHDTVLARNVTMAPGSSLAGHTTVDQGANLGMGSSVHQRRRVGAGAMVGMGAAVIRDVAPFTTVVGTPSRVVGANAVALRNLGAGDDVIRSWLDVVQGREGLPVGSPPALQALWSTWIENQGTPDRGDPSECDT